MKLRHLLSVGAGLSVGFLLAATAEAHFELVTPASWASQNDLGDPQKSAPCGQDDGTAPIETGTVTPFHPGDTVMVTINETIFHPGHYRVVLSTTGQAGLPADPPVTAGTTACGSTVIAASPTFPLLADGVLKHTSSFSGPQTFQVKLPDNVTCTGCTLQIAEFMSEHGLNNPGGCFYHHCANISITAGSGSGGTSGGGGAGGSGGSGADAGTVGGPDSGCGCGYGGSAGGSWFALVLVLAAVARRRSARGAQNVP